MGYLLKICWSIESGQQNEEKTLRKLVYGRAFFEVLISGESRTTDGHEVSGGCCPAMQAGLQEPLFYECTIWRKPNTEEKRSFFEVAWTK